MKLCSYSASHTFNQQQIGNLCHFIITAVITATRCLAGVFLTNTGTSVTGSYKARQASLSHAITLCMMHLQVISPRRTLVSVIILLFPQESPAAECPQGLFGPRCKYACYCQGNNCDADGNCVSGSSCRQQNFGPGCQYVNAFGPLKWWPFDSQCNNLPRGDSLTSKFLWPVPMTWLRLYVRRGYSAHRYQISMKLNGTEDCVNRRIYQFGSSYIDISCDNPIITSHIVTRGTVTDNLCQIYVSFGRNVARSQNITVFGSRGYSTSHSPVDDSFTCQTPENRLPAYDATVTFDRAYILHTIKFILAKDMLSKNNFSIKAYLGSTIVESMTETGIEKNDFHIKLSGMKLVDKIIIRADPEIEICEFQAFGGKSTMSTQFDKC
ncbi:hypothetical protein BsWGS_24628 [Bradybaena similaris]